MQRIEVEERRARLAVRHHVAPTERVESVVAVARGVVCLHASDPASVYLSAWARTVDSTLEAVDRALYDDRTLVRMLAMRRTMFVVPREDAPILHAAAALEVARRERKRNEELAAMLGVDDPRAWIEAAEAAALAALRRLGEATAQELSGEVPALREKVRVNVGKPYEGYMGMSSRVLLLLGLEGKVVRGRPRGTWISSQYRWAPMTGWLGKALPQVSEAEARTEVVRRWLSRFGPGTENDIRWWTGWTARSVRAALAAVDAVAVELDGQSGFVLPDDLESTPAPEPWVALLPSLDPTTMGWKEREWYLGGYADRLFDASGNAGPTIWVDGRIVGGWAMRPDGEVVTKLLEDVGRAASQSVDAEAGRLTEWLQAARVVPRFPTPLHKELIG
jgi:Winged helix DNA-binding domain